MANIGEYGFKIKNIEASTLLEYNWGIRSHYEYKNAMLVNSLLNDFLVNNGLETWNDESTRDIICLEFNYGTRSYDDELRHLYKNAVVFNREYKMAVAANDPFLINKAKAKCQLTNQLIIKAYKNKDVYHRYSVEEIRRILYTDGEERVL